MSSNAFLNGTRMSGVCAFIAGYFECEHKTLLIEMIGASKYPRVLGEIYLVYILRSGICGG